MKCAFVRSTVVSKTLSIFTVISLWLSPILAQAPAPSALPTGGQITGGQGSISSQGNNMTVNQSTQNLSAQWDTFNIGSDAGVTFQQPGSDSVALNHILDQSPSQIFGNLSANGNVFLLNPSGIVFGPSAQVDVGGLVASSLDLMETEQGYAFSGDLSRGLVDNQGQITANGGIVAFIGPMIQNQGTIDTPAGTSALTAGTDVSLDFVGDGLIRYQVNESDLTASATNTGTLSADGGMVVMSARTASNVVSGVVSNDGVVRANSLVARSGRIILEGETVTALGRIGADGDIENDGGQIEIQAGFAALGGTVSTEGANGGQISVTSEGNLSLAESVSAQGLNGDGGQVTYQAGARIIENNGTLTDVSGAKNGGMIVSQAGSAYASSGTYRADGAQGQGGQIDLTACDNLILLSSSLSATGQNQGGLIRVGGEFQGGKDGASQSADADVFLTRWGDLSALDPASTTFVNDGTVLDVSASEGQGGTAVVWSDEQTTMLGHVDATGATQGGTVEISSADELRHTHLENVEVGAGGTLLLDPKNITVGGGSSGWTYQAILGFGYAGSDDVDVSPLQASDYFGASVSLDDDGDRLAVGAHYDDGSDNSNDDTGAVYLFTFTDTDFSGGSLAATVGKGYSGGKNVDVSPLDLQDIFSDAFGVSVSLDGDGNRLAVGSMQDRGSHGGIQNAGAVYLFTFTDDVFSGGSLAATLGNRYTGGDNVSVPISINDYFGRSVSLDSDGDRLAVGAHGDDYGSWPIIQTDVGSAYLFTFTDTDFSGGILEAIVGKGASGGKNVDVSFLEAYDYFGSGVSLDGDGDRLAVGAQGDNGSGGPSQSGAVHLFTFADTEFSGGSLVASMGNGYTGGDNVDISTLGVQDYFGTSVSLDNDGDRLAVGAHGDDGNGDSANNSGAAYLFTFSDTSFSGGNLSTTLGNGYTDNGDMDVTTLSDGDYFGNYVSVDGDGDRLAVGAYFDDGSGDSSVNSGAAYLFELEDTSVTSNPLLYATNAAGNHALLAGDITTLLNAGTDVRLQANNDITVNSAVQANNSSGDGGDLILQAGRSVLINANLATDNGDLSVIANDITANGVVDAQRDAGAAVVTMAAGTSVHAGTGDVSVVLLDGSGKTQTTSGDITLGDVTAYEITALNQGPTVGSGVVLNGTLTATGNGDALVLAGKDFTNNTGAGALTATNGRWLVWSGNPADDTRGSVSYDFKQYNATYGVTAVAGGASEDGFLYSLAPSVTPGLTGTVSKAYDGTTTATLASDNYTVTGAVDSDTVTLNNPTNGTYDTKDVGTGKTVTVNGIGMGSADNGSATVYGYQMTSTTANATVGTVTAKALTMTNSSAADKPYDGTIAAAVTHGALSGFVGTETVTASSVDAFGSKDVGTGKTVTVTYTLNNGVNGGLASNYSLANDSLTADITKKPLTITGSSAANRTYDGTTAATVTEGVLSGFVGTETITTAATGTFSDKNVGVGKTVTAAYTLSDGTNGGLAGNYRLADDSLAADITAKALTINGSSAANKEYDGSAAATVTAGTLSGLAGSETVTTGATGVFDNANVGTGKTVTTTYTLSDGTNGGLASNYTLANENLSADITTKALSLNGLTANDKTYDATTVATIGTYGNLTGVVAGETVNLNNNSADPDFDTKDVGTNKVVTVASLALSGAHAGNYTLANQTTTADIASKALAVNGTRVANKTHDGATDAAVTVGALSGFVGTETVSATATGTFADAGIGVNKAVTVNYTLANGTNGGLAANYNLAAELLAADIRASLFLYKSTTDDSGTGHNGAGEGQPGEELVMGPGTMRPGPSRSGNDRLRQAPVTSRNLRVTWLAPEDGSQTLLFPMQISGDTVAVGQGIGFGGSDSLRGITTTSLTKVTISVNGQSLEIEIGLLDDSRLVIDLPEQAGLQDQSQVLVQAGLDAAQEVLGVDLGSLQEVLIQGN